MPILLLASPSQRKNLTSSPRRARSPPTPFLAAPPAQPVAQARQCGDRGFVLSCVDSGAERESPAPRVAAACLGHRTAGLNFLIWEEGRGVVSPPTPHGVRANRERASVLCPATVLIWHVVLVAPVWPHFCPLKQQSPRTSCYRTSLPWLPISANMWSDWNGQPQFIPVARCGSSWSSSVLAQFEIPFMAGVLHPLPLGIKEPLGIRQGNRGTEQDSYSARPQSREAMGGVQLKHSIPLKTSSEPCGLREEAERSLRGRG
ncbi:hypothetical protein AB1E18_013172 [Capra hircus]